MLEKSLSAYGMCLAIVNRGKFIILIVVRERIDTLKEEA